MASFKTCATNQGLLAYGITTNPDPLQASPESGNPVMGSLIITVSNNTSNKIYCNQLTFSFPIGDLAKDLTSAPSGILVSANSSDKWEISVTSDGVFTATPKSSSDNVIFENGLSFQIYNIQINQQVGTFTFSVIENSSTDKETFSDKTDNFNLAKFPYGFYVNNFASSATMVNNGGTVKLTWVGSDIGTYTIMYGTNSVNVTDIRTWTSPVLNDTTTFALIASVQEQGETVHNYLYITVIVADPEIKCTSLSAETSISTPSLVCVDGKMDIVDSNSPVLSVDKGASSTVTINTDGDTDSWSKLIFSNKTTSWVLGTSRDWMGNMFYLQNPLDGKAALFNFLTSGSLQISGAYSGLGIVPIGSIIPFAGDSANLSDGWLLCDGSEVSRTTYQSLYELIGDLYGKGDGSTTFNLPDYRGMFLRGVDHGAGQDPDSSSRTAQSGGTATGDNIGSRQDDELKKHSHSYVKFPVDNSIEIAGGTHWGDLDSQTGEYGGNETRPKNVYVNYLIRVL